MHEIELVKRCKHGDAKGQETLYARYADRMFRVGLRYIKNKVDTEDVMITAFTRIFRHINSFEYLGEGSLEGWIRRIVVNESLMWLRRRHNFNMIDSMDASLAEVDLFELSELEADDILKLVAQLPIGYRTVFNLFVIEGFNHLEIATELEISESTSRSQLFKAKTLLRKMLTQEGFQYGT